jgi:phosphoketolase
MISMASSSSFLDKWNKEKEQFTITNPDNSSSNYIDLENILKNEEDIICHQTVTEPYQISSKNKSP